MFVGTGKFDGNTRYGKYTLDPSVKPVYEVVTGEGEVYRRNRRHFRRTYEPVVDSEADVQVQDDEEPLIVTGQCHSLEGLDRVEPRQDKDVQRTRSGRTIKLPERFKDFEMN